VISDRGTPDDDSDDATVTIDMVMELKNFNWSSNVGIDAIYVKGGSEGSYFYGYQPDVSHEGQVVGPGEEATEDIDLGTPPWKVEGKNQISHVTFCWDDEQGPTTSSSSTSSTTSTSMPTPTTACPGAPVDLQEGETGGMPDDETSPSSEPEPTTSSSEPDTPDECETTTTAPPTTAPSTTVSIEPDVSTTVLDSGPTTTLPITPQSNSLPDTGSNTTPLILGGIALLAIGGGLIAGNKWLRKA
jgi:LPXTG-motif cell wall-anchored protein